MTKRMRAAAPPLPPRHPERKKTTAGRQCTDGRFGMKGEGNSLRARASADHIDHKSLKGEFT